MKCAIYARYSSDRQNERSAEDQARLCQERADREGWTVAGIYPDLALSGATRDRPGLNALLDAAARFDVVLAESLDRVSRDLEDIAGIFKRLRFAGVRLVTLSEGEIGDMHVGLGGTMNALFLKQLGEKTRRGQAGRVELGRIPGGLSYGYRMANTVDAQGRVERGLRQIDHEQAAVVRRIFADYLAGHAPKAIAEALNRDGIPGPTGGRWAASTILGNRRRGTGILHNALFDGRIVYNRQRFEKHPETRRRIARPNPESEWRTAIVPDLAIVDRATWEAVQHSFDALAGTPAVQRRRPKRLLSGLVRCGVCEAGYIVRTGHYWGCAGRASGKGCTNAAMITADELERRVLDALGRDMLAPDVVAEYVAERQRLSSLEAKGRARERSTLERRHARAQAQIARLVDALADGRVTVDDVHARMRELGAERDRLAAELAEASAENEVTAHPNLAEEFRRTIARMVEALRDPDNHDARSLIRDMIETIVATPRPGGKGVDLILQGRLAAILAITQESRSPRGPASLTASMVAGTGFMRWRSLTRLAA